MPIPSVTPAYPWYGIRTRSHFEKVSLGALTNMGYTAYLPLYQARRHWSDRVVTIDCPLFPGYVFCRFDRLKRLPILKAPGVVDIIGLGREPEAIPNHEIDSIQTILESGLGAEPWPYLREGQRIRVRRGSLQGLEGILVKKKTQWRIVVSVTLLQRSVAVEIDREWITPVR